MNSDNPEHVLQAQPNEGDVYHAIASSSQAELTRSDQSNIYLICSKFNISVQDVNSNVQDLITYLWCVNDLFYLRHQCQ